MELSPKAIPFFSCMDNKTLNERDTFLCKAHSNLSHFDSLLLCEILSFNVLDLDLCIQEVLLLANSFKLDILILLETGSFDLQHCNQVFSNYKTFFQKGENPNGGVIILVRNDLKTNRIHCVLPNICVIDVLDDSPFRII